MVCGTTFSLNKVRLMDAIDHQKLFFRPICSNAEIERIFNVTDAKDHLLKLRAETIVDHMRLFRVYRNKALKNEQNWTLEAAFADSHYKAVLAKLPKDARALCSVVTYGDIFSDDPNGMIFNTPYGPITTISESLKFFLKFSHLAILEFEEEVPMRIRVNALRIAIRIMLRKEAMDFYMDPRGVVPPRIATAIHAPIPLQLKFIAGHEFAHFIFGHMSESNLIDQPVFYALSSSENEYKSAKVYNTSQRNEFEADLQAILLPRYSDRQRKELLCAALLWFGCLELFHAARDVIFPQGSWCYQSHPTPRERYENLLANISSSGLNSRHWSEFPSLIENLKGFLQNDISLHFDDYEMYGSFYLDEPNTQWRGRELIDRVDYY